MARRLSCAPRRPRPIKNWRAQRHRPGSCSGFMAHGSATVCPRARPQARLDALPSDHELAEPAAELVAGRCGSSDEGRADHQRPRCLEKERARWADYPCSCGPHVSRSRAHQRSYSAPRKMTRSARSDTCLEWTRMGPGMSLDYRSNMMDRLRRSRCLQSDGAAAGVS